MKKQKQIKKGNLAKEMSKKEKEELEKFEIETIEQRIEAEKVALDRYVQTIVRSSFLDCCTGGAYFNEMHTILLRQGFDELEKSKKTKEEKNKLRMGFFILFTKGETKLEIMKANLEYQKRLTNWAKNMLSMLNDEKKEKIIKDCITQQEMWSSQFDRNSKLYEELEK